MAPAISSFPVPDSPVIRTVASVGAIWTTVSRSRVIAAECPRRLVRSYCSFRFSRSIRFSSARCRCSMALRIVSFSSSKSRGFVR